MSGIAITGWGAVSPAGWSVAALRDAVAKGDSLAAGKLECPEPGDVNALRVPPANPKPAFMAHARLRRSSPITQYAVAAGLEALGTGPGGTSEVGVVMCVFSGCVSYSRRFYGEALRDPGTASPLVFPETVFNAPASHLSAYLGSKAINYTLVGDAGTYLTGLAMGAQWVAEGRVARCLVVGTEETDWLTADALALFDRGKIASEGAGALLLEKGQAGSAKVWLERITDEHLYGEGGKREALRRMREELGAFGTEAILFDGITGEGGISREESELWRDWEGMRVSPKRVAGEGLMAAAAWQCVLGADAIANGAGREAVVSIGGFHQHAVAARFTA